MKRERLRTLGALVLTVIASSFAAKPMAAQAKLVPGKLAGVVRDVAGTPQMGASVELLAETAGLSASHSFLTNTQGAFRGDKLAPGLYTVRVTLAGFLPTLEKHVRISPNLTTVVRLELESMYASLDQLRHMPSSSLAQADEWKWVLRSASAARPVLEWVDSDPSSLSTARVETRMPQAPRMRMEFTNGARRAASASNIAPSPATAVAYDQSLGGTGSLIFAGEMSYDSDAPSGGIATVWMPTGTLGAGPHTALVLREAKIAPDGPNFRGVRLDQGGALALSNRLVLRYGAEYVLVGLGAAASSVRPRSELSYHVSDNWTTELIFGSMPNVPGPLEAAEEGQQGMLSAALNELDAFPALLWRAGRPVLQSGWHEELALDRKVGGNGKLQFAGFHDDNRHVAIYGRGGDLPVSDYFQDYFSKGFAYDGGSSSSWGARVALREKLFGDTDLTTVYSFGGALLPFSDTDDLLRNILRTVPRHSLGAGISTKLPRSGTKLQVAYKWVNGTAASRVDAYGESLYQMDPFLHLTVRQPLPKWALGRWEAIADCDNLLAQGYVSTASRDGRVQLIPAFRTFRGGLSVQF
ncbi:MAG TPA: carboxypeptidase-like regulatory domain-containing protein [Candidatus Angelobacter sp.]|nr:carboxypeptidase-like regulatory domain-containing protein [Candidatus Angelobacter sp.]